MKLKSLLFGSAAAMMAVTGAQAADPPIAEPVEYVRVCDAYGAGYHYIPGTDTCLKIGGYVRVEAYFQDNDQDVVVGEDIIVEDNNNNNNLVFVTRPANASKKNWSTFARGAINLDARTMTDIGVVRAAWGGFFNVNSQFAASENNADGTSTDFAFIQVINDGGTLTIGHTGSFFNFKGSGTLEGVGAQDPNTTLLGYTFNLGGGMSASIAIEDGHTGGRFGGIYSESNSGFPDAFYGDALPDVTANIRGDIGGMTVQVMGALHNNDVFDGWWATDSWSELGWAVGAGVSGSFGGASAYVQAFYADGATKYAWSPVSGTSTWDFAEYVGGFANTSETFFVNGNIVVGLGATMEAKLSASYGDFDGGVPGGFGDFDEWAVAGDLWWKPNGQFNVGVGVVCWETSYNFRRRLGDDDGCKGRIRAQSSF